MKVPSKVGIVLTVDDSRQVHFHSAHFKRKDTVAESERLRHEEGKFTQWFWLDYEEDGILVNINTIHFYCGNQCRYAKSNGFFFKLGEEITA